MRRGLWVLCFFAAVWAVAGVLVDGAPTWWIGPPIVLSGAILIFALRRAGSPQESAPHVGRLIGTWSAIEGIAMFLAANVLVNLHLRQAIEVAFRQGSGERRRGKRKCHEMSDPGWPYSRKCCVSPRTETARNCAINDAQRHGLTGFNEVGIL